jgi:hypothetical protein
LFPEIQVRKEGLEAFQRKFQSSFKGSFERNHNANKKQEPQTQLNRFVSQGFPCKGDGPVLNFECFLQFRTLPVLNKPLPSKLKMPVTSQAWKK